MDILNLHPILGCNRNKWRFFRRVHLGWGSPAVTILGPRGRSNGYHATDPHIYQVISAGKSPPAPRLSVAASITSKKTTKFLNAKFYRFFPGYIYLRCLGWTKPCSKRHFISQNLDQFKFKDHFPQFLVSKTFRNNVSETTSQLAGHNNPRRKTPQIPNQYFEAPG